MRPSWRLLRWHVTALCVVVVCFSPTVLSAQPHLPAGFADDLDAFVSRVMETNLAPGMAVAVVRGPDLIYAKGFGFADRERGKRANADTEFYIASTTKSFTALTGALLANRGDLDLDAPLSRYLPDVRLHEGLDPQSITLRNLLTHTHGIQPGGPVDLRTAFSGEFTDSLLLQLLKYHPPATTGREFAYSNLGYNIFSLVLDAKFNDGWKAIVDQEVFRPLGMKRTTAFVSKADQDNIAVPYRFDGNSSQRVAFAKRDANMQAAGGHLSSANDLARYLQAHLNHGRIEGKQLLPAAVVDATHAQQVPQNRRFGPFVRFGWGLGWDMATYEGDTVLQRFGDFPGFRSHVSFMPERGIGVVVLTNDAVASPLTDLIAVYVYDRLLNKPDLAAKYSALPQQLLQEQWAVLERERTTRSARPQVTPLPLSAYAGTYESVALGRMVWTFQDGRLNVKMGIAESGVEVYDGGKYQLRVTIFGGGSVVTFQVPDGAQRPTGLTLNDYEFQRIAE